MPGATEIFADALYGNGTRGSGDTKKLFKDMEDGKVRMEQLVKVIEYMRKLTDDKKVAEYVKASPEKAFQRMSNAWIRLIMEVNNAGLLDAMTAALDGAADALKFITPAIKTIANIFKEMWVVIKPLAAMWLFLFGYKKLIPLIKYLTKTQIGLALFTKGVTAAKVASNGFITAQFMMGAALSRLNTIFKRSIVILAIAAIIDLIETLQGKQTILSDMMDGGGFWGNLAKGFVVLGRLFQGLGEFIGQFIAALVTGDWGQFDFSDLKKDLLELFPFDSWWKGFTSLLDRMMERVKLFSSATATSLNPFASKSEAAEAWRKYDFQKNLEYMTEMGMTGYNKQSAALAPLSVARRDPSTVNQIQVTIPINGTGLDPQAISQAVADQFNLTFTKYQANYVMAR